MLKNSLGLKGFRDFFLIKQKLIFSYHHYSEIDC